MPTSEPSRAAYSSSVRRRMPARNPVGRPIATAMSIPASVSSMVGAKFSASSWAMSPPGRIAGDQAQRQKDDRYHAQQHRQHGDDPAEKVAAHGSRASGVGRPGLLTP